MAKIMAAKDGSGFTIWDEGSDLAVVEIRQGESKEDAWRRAVKILAKFQNDQINKQEEEVLF